MRRRAFPWALVVLLWAAGAAWPAECPPALTAAAEAYRQRLDAQQQAIRGSGPDAPLGVEPTMMFDRASHGCHEGRGQAYRVYRAFRCTEVGEDEAVVRYPYRLFFRRALTLEELFGRAWEQGSDGILEVRFQREGDRWVPVSRREVLDMGGSGTRRGGEPAPDPVRPRR